MHIEQVIYRQGTGWSGPLPAALDGERTLLLVFAAPHYANDPAPFDDLAAAFPQATRIGCSTAGEIAGAQVHDASVCATVVQFEHTALRVATTPIDGSAGSLAAGERLAAQLPHAWQGEPLCGVLLLSDGLHVNGTPLVDGLAAGLPAGVVITGGLSGDGSRFQHTFVLVDGRPQVRHVCALGLYGRRLHVGHGCDGGWSDFGPERRITRAEGNVLYELDGRPALDLYKTYLGDLADGLPGTALLFPLSVRREGADGHTRVRTVLSVDEAQRSMTFAGDLPEGGTARLMRAKNDNLIHSAAAAARDAGAGLGTGRPVLVLSVSCVGRRLILGERTEEEVEAVLDGAPRGAVHTGFYSYGEIAPALPGHASGLHNQTMTITALAEA